MCFVNIYQLLNELPWLVDCNDSGVGIQAYCAAAAKSLCKKPDTVVEGCF